MWCPNDKQAFLNSTGGQIIPTELVGQTLIKYIKDVKNIVEIGTWNGLGSTRCFLLGLQENTKFYTIETNKDKWLAAIENSKEFITSNVNFLWGSVIRESDIKNLLVIFPNLRINQTLRGWHKIDMENLKNSPNVLSELPDQIEFLFLDGGELTTWYEFQLLFPRCTRYIGLDDINTAKCSKIRYQLKTDTRWKEVECIHERNGFSLFEKI